MRGRPLYLTMLGGALVLAFLLRSLPSGVVIVLALVAVRAPMPVVAIGGRALRGRLRRPLGRSTGAAEVLDEALRGGAPLAPGPMEWALELRDRILLSYPPVAGMDQMESLATVSLVRRALVSGDPARLRSPGSGPRSVEASARYGSPRRMGEARRTDRAAGSLTTAAA